MKNLNLYLIRHGKTEWNTQDRMQGSKNSPLTGEGILGAKLTGKYLQNIPFIAAYSSPQQRAIDTRDLILSQHNNIIPKGIVDNLSEMDFGSWEGVHVSELRKLPEFDLYMNHPANFDSAKNNGEDYSQLLKRLQEALNEIIDRTEEQQGNILIVSHGTALRLLLCVLNGGDWKQHRDDNYFPRMLNTSISKVNYQGNGKTGEFTVEFINNVDHIKNSNDLKN